MQHLHHSACVLDAPVLRNLRKSPLQRQSRNASNNIWCCKSNGVAPRFQRKPCCADDSLKAVQASLKASLASLRDEMNRKLQALTIEIAQLQKQMNVARGEQSILSQQQKDTAKRVDIVSSTVSELSAEIVGDESAQSVAAVQGAAY